MTKEIIGVEDETVGGFVHVDALRKIVERMKADEEEACDCGKWYLKHWVSELEELYDGGE